MNDANGISREETLRILRQRVEFYTDCTEPGKPIYHSLARLAQGFSGYTGYLDSTPLESWTETQRNRRWYALKASAKRQLWDCEHGKTGKARRNARRNCSGRTMRNSASRFYRRRVLDGRARALQFLRDAGQDGLTARELYEAVFQEKCKTANDRARIHQVITELRKENHTIEIIRRAHSGQGRGSYPRNSYGLTKSISLCQRTLSPT